MINNKTSKQLRKNRQARIRVRVQGTSERPRLSVFRSNKSLYVQVIDDSKGVTIFSKSHEGKNSEAAVLIGKEIAVEAKNKGIKKVVFDRGGFRYHGVIKLIADTVREGGIDL